MRHRWAAWGNPRIVMDEPAVEVRVLDKKPPERFRPAPEPLAGLKRPDLAQCAAARLDFESSGVDGANYTSYLYLNGVKLSPVPPSGNDTWVPAEVAVPKEALATLGPYNSLIIKNPGCDCMKVRAFCLHFDLQDGRKGSSMIDQGPYCSDRGWLCAEGTCVALGENLTEILLNIACE